MVEQHNRSRQFFGMTFVSLVLLFFLHVNVLNAKFHIFDASYIY